MAPVRPMSSFHTDLSRSAQVVIETKRLYKVYHGRAKVVALHNLTLSIYAGEIVVLKGPSGCGKTTLLNLVAGLDRPTSGDIYVAGQALSLLSEDHLAAFRRANVGYVFQSFNLLSQLTAAQNVALPLECSTSVGWYVQEKVDTLLNHVGLSHRRHHRPSQLSGGEKQRIALARALVNEPDIVLADEPTGNLDSQSSLQIASLISELNRLLGQTFVLVSHDRHFDAVADRILYMKDGGLVGEEAGATA